MDGLLDRIDLDRVFATAESKGFLTCEIYAEQGTQTCIQLFGKIEEVTLNQVGGIALRCFDGRAHHIFSSHETSTDAIVALLEGETTAASEAQKSINPRRLEPTEDLNDPIKQLALVYRQTFPEGEGIRYPGLTYEARSKHFEVANSASTRQKGSETSAEISVFWSVARKGIQHYQAEKARASAESLFRELKQENPFRERVLRSLSGTSPWPAPKGNVPILWSARAFSKLCLHFLRAFEGDLVLRNTSFLAEAELPAPLKFTVSDTPDSARCPFDHEGSPTRTVPVFGDGRPKSLACNRSVAELLSVSTTGHCRRESFHSAPTVGFWNPRIQGDRTVENPLKSLPWGLSARDLEVLHFDPSTGEIHFRFNDLRLIHHGEEGESVESVDVKSQLLPLLQTFCLFSESFETAGYHITKNQQRFLTEISTPSAVSEPLFIPGKVPLNHYW